MSAVPLKLINLIMPIIDNNPNGRFQTADEWGMPIVGETRQCIHCQFVWEYRPRTNLDIRDWKSAHENIERTDGEVKAVKRGFCRKHQGLICCREECLAKYGLAPFCTSFEEEETKRQAELRAKYEIKGNKIIQEK